LHCTTFALSNRSELGLNEPVPVNEDRALFAKPGRSAVREAIADTDVA